MPTTRVKGGKNLARFLKNAYRAERATNPNIEVGFGDARINALAVQLEFGNPQTKLPERPAFRMGVQDMLSTVAERAEAMKRKDVSTGRLGYTAAQARELAVLGRDTNPQRVSPIPRCAAERAAEGAQGGLAVCRRSVGWERGAEADRAHSRVRKRARGPMMAPAGLSIHLRAARVIPMSDSRNTVTAA